MKTGARYHCPGCSVTLTLPPKPEAPCASTDCKHCGAPSDGVERRSRVCPVCGICALCDSAHTVLASGAELMTARRTEP